MPFPRSGGKQDGKMREPPWADLVNSIGSYPSPTEFSTIDVPVVCTYGARSPAGMFRLTRSLAAAIPSAKRIESRGPATQSPSMHQAPSCS